MSRLVAPRSFSSFSPASIVPVTEIATPKTDLSGSMALLAVPKKQVSYSKRRIRAYGQRMLDERKNPVMMWKACPHCGSPIRPHFVCLKCMKL